MSNLCVDLADLSFNQRNTLYDLSNEIAAKFKGDKNTADFVQDIFRTITDESFKISIKFLAETLEYTGFSPEQVLKEFFRRGSAEETESKTIMTISSTNINQHLTYSRKKGSAPLGRNTPTIARLASCFPHIVCYFLSQGVGKTYIDESVIEKTAGQQLPRLMLSNMFVRLVPQAEDSAELIDYLLYKEPEFQVVKNESRISITKDGNNQYAMCSTSVNTDLVPCKKARFDVSTIKRKIDHVPCHSNEQLLENSNDVINSPVVSDELKQNLSHSNSSNNNNDDDNLLERKLEITPESCNIPKNFNLSDKANSIILPINSVNVDSLPPSSHKECNILEGSFQIKNSRFADCLLRQAQINYDRDRDVDVTLINDSDENTTNYNKQPTNKELTSNFDSTELLIAAVSKRPTLYLISESIYHNDLSILFIGCGKKYSRRLVLKTLEYTSFSPEQVLKEFFRRGSAITVDETWVIYADEETESKTIMTISSKNINQHLVLPILFCVMRGTATKKIQKQWVNPLNFIFNAYKTYSRKKGSAPLGRNTPTIARIASCFPHIVCYFLSQGVGKTYIDESVIEKTAGQQLPRLMLTNIFVGLVPQTGDSAELIDYCEVYHSMLDMKLSEKNPKQLSDAVRNVETYTSAAVNSSFLSQEVKKFFLGVFGLTQGDTLSPQIKRICVGSRILWNYAITSKDLPGYFANVANIPAMDPIEEFKTVENMDNPAKFSGDTLVILVSTIMTRGLSAKDEWPSGAEGIPNMLMGSQTHDDVITNREALRFTHNVAYLLATLSRVLTDKSYYYIMLSYMKAGYKMVALIAAALGSPTVFGNVDVTTS
ncbi:unnamed protein product [Phaedon cochleariae]|uniref:Uncharacterized protein n=1 Tax=Phaedon cochleariae TaxID=80249 RepID=A0A9N9X0Q5_PHACE|nr:unnamed protein product [Phaedon cochleariae]